MAVVGCYLRKSWPVPSVTAILGYWAAHLAVLELSGLRRNVNKSLVLLDLDAGTVDSLSVERRPDCAVCGNL